MLLGPEERDRIEGFAAAEHVARRRLALALGDDEMLDADRFAAVRIRPARDVAGREHMPGAGLEELVDQHAAVDGEAGLFGQRDRRTDADADDDEVGVDAVPLSSVTPCSSIETAVRPRWKVTPCCSWTERMNDPSSGPSTRAIGIASGPTTCTSRPRARSDEATSRPMKLAPMITALRGRFGLCDQRAAVGERAQIMNMAEVRAGNVEPDRLGAGRKQKRAVAHAGAVRELDLPLAGVDPRHARVQAHIDLVLPIEVRRTCSRVQSSDALPAR